MTKPERGVSVWEAVSYSRADRFWPRRRRWWHRWTRGDDY